MDLIDAASFFDSDPVYDGYTGAALFNVQAASFNDSTADGATNRRRIISTASDLVMPARRVISLYGDRWLVGVGTPDGFGGEVVRQQYNAKRVTDLMRVLTPGQALNVASGLSAYVQKMYLKDIVNSLTDSEYDTQWNIFIAPDEPARKGAFLRDAAGRLYRVRNDYLPTEGLRILQSDELDSDAIQQCKFDTGTMDPITETVAAGTTTVNGIRVDTPKFYRFRHVSEGAIQPGDMCLFVPSYLALRQGMTFTMDGLKWQVVTFQPELDAQAALVRRA